MHIIIAHFGTYYVGMPGGVEKVTCNLANAMIQKGHRVTILYRDSKEGSPYFPLDTHVAQHNILFENGVQKIPEKLPWALRAEREAKRIFSQNAAQAVNAKYKGQQYGPAIQKWMEKLQPDVVLSCSIPSTKYVIEDAEYKGPVITMIHADPSKQFADLSKLERKAVSKSAVIQLLLPSGVKIARQYFPDIPLAVIGNAVPSAEKIADLKSNKNHYVISCVGNICERKNQGLLVEVFSKLMKDFPQWNLELWGRCTSRYAVHLRQEIYSKGWNSRIFIKGETNHVDEVYAQSDIFSLLSTSEGFGLALAEAMAAGLPSVGLQRCFGIRDLIESGKTGILTEENPQSIEMVFRYIMKDRELREIMGEKARTFIKKYEPILIWEQWDNLFMQMR